MPSGLTAAIAEAGMCFKIALGMSMTQLGKELGIAVFTVSGAVKKDGRW
jgi:DNA-binding CsgD family transcriptional regulator